ncbi:acetylornithine deacetylase [Pseudoclavibacter endophyticus]|uniref:ArgE/DapE family deacylase n=1 Tax=Pseudoclavibacter endophyticus TaxID=1778590 RepID=A0A6H9WBU5_9MICO|nr:ArgE/DapE family deacylase [Pseudoclavibacter endophyticus]KAB1648130.1 ArgE/DapE family deacylase [Pseudoclavibacter endophyticus]GGA69983.1 acetylornithine deacetylase [Pseudoclavibacter endophyticus]
MINNELSGRILAAVDTQFDEQLNATAELVACPSLRAGEEAAQDLIEQRLRALDLEVDRWTLASPDLEKHPGYGPPTVDYNVMTNVVGTYRPAQERGNSLILNGHIDVVPEGPRAQWSRSPWDAEVRDGWMYGRGAGDMKAGLIANLFAFDAISKAGLELTGRVHLQSVVEEECTGNGSLAALLRGYVADAVIIPEPEDDALVRANVGVLWFTARVTGNPTHPREMANGFNAIDAAYDVVAALRELEESWNRDKGNHRYFEDLEHPINFNIGCIQGGDWPSSVPAWCEVRVRVATYPGTTADEAWGEIVRRVEQASQGAPFDVELTPDGFYADGYVLEPGSDAEALLEQTHEATFASPLTSFTTPGYLDGRVFVNYGNIPTLVYGPVSENIHAFDERVSVESIRKCTKSIALFLASWCGVSERR